MIDEKEREIWIEESRFYLDKDNILYESVVGEIDKKKAIAMEEASIKLRKMVPGKVNVLVDINQAKKPTPEARNFARRRLEGTKTGKVAIFGMHPVARVIAAFVMSITKKEDMRFFKSKEEALIWLKE